MTIRRFFTSFTAAVLGILILFTLPILAQEDPEEDQDEKKTGFSTMELLREKITGFSKTTVSIVSSGSTETTGDWITIRENAEIQIGLNKSLLADKILYNPSENILRAEGNVILLENKMRIGGDSLDLNLEDNTGEIINPYIETSDGTFISGEKLIKVAPDEYELYGAKITSCNQPTPQWQIGTNSITLKAGESATLRNVTIKLFDTLPIFWAPWMKVPLEKQRSSGFLIPEWGSSDFHGFWASEKFFWAINDSHDATVGLDYYEKRGNRYSLEYRNNMGDGNFTDIFWYYIQDENFYGESSEKTRDRYHARFLNRTMLPLNFVFDANVQFLGDNSYYRDFVNRDKIYTPLFRKDISLTNNYDGYNFYVGYNEVNRFLTRNKLRQIQFFPKVILGAREKPIFDTPLFYSFSGNFIRPHIRQVFRRAEFEREDLITDSSYNRLDFQADIKLPIKNFSPWLTFTPRFVYRRTDYSMSWNERKTAKVEESITRDYYDIDMEMIGPIVSKVYGDPNQSNHLFKHVIEPKLKYLYRSEIDDDISRRIIVLDGTDTFFRVNELKWTLTNTIYYKRNYPNSEKQGAVYELFKLGVSQFVSMDEELLTNYDKKYVFDPSRVEPTTQYSPLLFDISSNMFNYLRTNLHLEYDTEESELINYTVSGSLNYGPVNYRVAWYKTIGVVRFDRAGVTVSKTDRLITSGSLRLFDGLIRLRGQWDYDYAREKALGYMGGIDISGQCIGASFEAGKINILGQSDFQTRFSIVLGNLGKIFGGGGE